MGRVDLISAAVIAIVFFAIGGAVSWYFTRRASCKDATASTEREDAANARNRVGVQLLFDRLRGFIRSLIVVGRNVEAREIYDESRRIIREEHDEGCVIEPDEG